MTVSSHAPTFTDAVYDLYVYDEYNLAHPLALRYKALDLPNPNDSDGAGRFVGATTEEAVLAASQRLAEWRLWYPTHRFTAKVWTGIYNSEAEIIDERTIDLADLEAVGYALMDAEVQHEIAA